MLSVPVALLLLQAEVWAQLAGHYVDEIHPPLSWKRCSGTNGNTCETVQGEVVADANWRWIHVNGTYLSCYTGNQWDVAYCPDNQSCAKSCAVEGTTYQDIGITTSNNTVRMRYYTPSAFATNYDSRLFLMRDSVTYETFQLIGNEIAFDVDTSTLGCGIVGSLYFVGMDPKGQGVVGAKYGTGYCDAQCRRDLKFINGSANVEGWQPSATEATAGTGHYGACCPEVDVWQANAISNAFALHPCDQPGFSQCTGDACGGMFSADRYAGGCDPDGCEFNPYRLGVKDFYGKGGQRLDSSKKMTVVTQFHGSGTNLTEVKRFYIQGGLVFENPSPAVAGITGNSLTSTWCDAEHSAIGDKAPYAFHQHGGMKAMGEAMARGMVLVMTIRGSSADALWLDSDYPVGEDPTLPAVSRGTCPKDPATPLSLSPSPIVEFSNIRFGPIGSTI